MKRHERSLARRCALQVLYQSEILNKPADQVVDEGLVPAEAGVDDYARMLIMGVSSHKSELDRTIGESSQNWAIDRMPVVDRSVLRLAAFEMEYVDDVPVSVSINEAVELAKEFGGEDDSHRFVNGILGRIARDSALERAVNAPIHGVSAAQSAPTDACADGEAAEAADAVPADEASL
ncbi:MAG: transcription antitermination factor NusB [Slackia sp.]|nr:transcription antitermination factor NusB [Slackia sp.]